MANRVLGGLLLVAVVAGFTHRAPVAVAGAPPNVVLVVSDDQHWRDYRSAGRT